MLPRLDSAALFARGEVPVYQHAAITSVRELPARTVSPVGLIDLGGYVLREGDEVIDHVRGTVHRNEGVRLVRV